MYQTLYRPVGQMVKTFTSRNSSITRRNHSKFSVINNSDLLLDHMRQRISFKTFLECRPYCWRRRSDMFIFLWINMNQQSCGNNRLYN